MAVAEQARQRRLAAVQTAASNEAADAREIELAGELELAHAKIAGLERRMAHEAASTRGLSEQMQLLAAQAETAEKRVAELERELEAARDSLALQDNESHSLRASLDLTMSENARLSQCLGDKDAALTEALAKQQFLQSAYDAAETECTRLTDDLIKACERRRTESEALGGELEAMSKRASAAEALLGEARECLLHHIAQQTAAEGRLADAIAAHDAARGAAERKIKELNDTLHHEQCRVDELERSRLELIEATNTLLKTFQHRDVAFQSAGQKIECLNRQIAELQAEARRGDSRQPADSADRKPHSGRTERARADDGRDPTRMKWAELARELARLVDQRRRFSDHPHGRTAPALLAGSVAA